tara:strand:- start:141 stop:320 length:180 start_codon:yes stop_codon:yes gene_type:complete
VLLGEVDHFNPLLLVRNTVVLFANKKREMLNYFVANGALMHIIEDVLIRNIVCELITIL